MFEFFRKLFSPVIAILDFITKYFKTIVFLTIIYVVFFNSDEERISTKSTANLQKIELVGPIIDVSKTLENIEKAKTDTNIKGVLFVVDSPGGAVAPSVEVAYAIKELKQIKPVVVYASGVIASGSYYASIWADKIIANPGSMVGSIGVIMQGVNTKELMDKIGIQTQTVKAGKYKESGTPTRKWTEFEEKQLQSVIDDTYNMFITDVATARNLDIKNYTSFADAKIFTSKQAKDVGLVDEVANITVAQKTLAELSKVENPVWKKEDKFEKFMDKLVSEAVSQISMNFVTGLKAY
ncbi:signal peptide peptidase protease IV [Aliarcobacter butzleri 7h1h]|uniref:Signal peptide peptidase SppA n=1 Tax=Aliarcobacter butzleri TaxID=28197 RepID=A0AAW6VG25_9BACT|nr:signal peptide peptidase SppA [Aliarcobacter butzleri]AGR76814.1 signal peptide peptidase protease IV [Aliarcobacter butzleri 7h1h]KLD96371.1 endopeptidase IV [Aliarcobacter butzleri L349]KLE07566.1 endopeptidase IV [Aliarcobacter butzleri L354]MCG3680465.1 signal peptide peptidase SppA [Aliarcobacter butzleri]MDK2041474.1 signal peptide peptidase SppA [Aliarcobacter butzleri]